MAATAPMLVALVQPMLDGVYCRKKPRIDAIRSAGDYRIVCDSRVAGHIGAYAINWLGSKMVMDLQVEMFDKLLMLPAPYCCQSRGCARLPGSHPAPAGCP